MGNNIGTQAVAAMLFTLSPDEQHSCVAQFIQHELDEAQQRNALLEQQALLLSQQQQHASPQAVVERRERVESLKIDVSKYKGLANESLLRWLVELDTAIEARRIEDHSMQVTFAMSNLAGRAKTWAYGRRLADPHCFPTLESFKSELREAFEPPKTEFRARAELLELKRVSVTSALTHSTHDTS